MFDINTQQLANAQSPVVPIVENERRKVLDKVNNSVDLSKYLGVDNTQSSISFTPEKIALRDTSPESFTDAYVQLNSGDYVKRFENYLPFSNNEERLAQQQSTGDKWFNGTAKFGTATLNAVAGATVGLLYGVNEMVQQGSLNAMFDNDATRWLDDLNTKMQYRLPNYYTQQEKDAGFFESLGSANFIANDIFGAASFTIGAIVSEGIWAAATGGASLATTGARWGLKSIGFAKTAKGLSTYKGWLKEGVKNAYRNGAINKQQAINYSKAFEALNATRFLITSSGYEAGVEALHFKKEAEENFRNNFIQANGRPPEASEMVDFYDDLANGANAVFGANMAILAPSNLAMFGSMFNIASPFKSVTKGLNKSIYGIGTEKLADGTVKALAPTKFQSLARKVLPLTKGMVVEGLYEEGFQSVASKTAEHWLDSKYDPTNNAINFSLYEGLYDAFGETYGTKEGWKELGIGMIIGGVFGGVGNYSELKGAVKSEEYKASVENTFIPSQIAQRYLMSSQIQEAVKRQNSAIQNGDRVEATIAANEVVMANIAARHASGESLSELVSEYSLALDGMTVEDFKNIGVAENEIAPYKSEVVRSLTKLVESYETNKEFADRILGVDRGKWVGQREANQELHAQALAHIITVGEVANVTMQDIIDEMGSVLSMEQQTSLRVQAELQLTQASVRQELANNAEELKRLQKEQKAYEETLRKIQNRPSTRADIKGDTATGEQYATVAEKLLKVNERINEVNQNLDRITNQIREEYNKRNASKDIDLSKNLLSEYITTDQLLSLEENLKAIDNLVEGYRQTNPVTFDKIARLSRDYKKAQDKFMDYQNAMLAMSSPSFKLKSSNNWLSSMLTKGKTMDEFTSEFLQEVVKKGGIENTLSAAAQEIQNQQKQEEQPPATNPNQPILTEEAKNKAEVEKLTQELERLKAELNSIALQEAGITEARNLKEGDVITVLTPKGVEEYTVDAVNQNVGGDVYNIETKEGVTLRNPMLAPKSQPWLLNKVVGQATSPEVLQRKQELENKINNITKKIESLQPIKPLKSELEQLKDRLENALKNKFYPINKIFREGEEYTDKLPTQAEIDEYADLFSRGGEVNRSEAEQKRFEELGNKLSDWQLLDSAAESETQTLADIIELISQLETQIEQEVTVDEITKEDLPSLISKDFEGSDTTVDYSLGMTPNTGVFVKKHKDETVTLHHVLPQTLAANFAVKIVSGKKVIENATEKDIEKYRKKDGTVFTLTDAEGNEISFTARERGILEFAPGVFEDSAPFFNLFMVDMGTTWTYKDVYMYNGTDFVPAESDFIIEGLDGDIFELSKEDELEVYFDVADEYNAGLKGDEKDTRNNLKLTLRKDGKNYVMLKSLREDAADPLMLEYRELAMQLRAQGLSGGVGKMKVAKVLFGTPKFTLNQEGQSQENEFTDRAVEQVVTTGFVEDGKITLADKTIEGKAELSFTGDLGKKYKGAKLPVVVFKKGAHFIAFPISLKKTDAPKVKELNDILNSEMSATEKVKRINELLISVGISPSTFNLIELTQEKIEAITEQLNNIKDFVPASELANPNYDKTSLKEDATIRIDLEDLPSAFTTPKLKLDLETATVAQSRDYKYDNMTEVENVLNDMMLDINKQVMTNYKDSKGEAIEDKFTEKLDDLDVILKAQIQSQLDKQHNANALKELIKSENQTKASRALLKPMMPKIKQALDRYEFLKKNITPPKGAPNLKC